MADSASDFLDEDLFGTAGCIADMEMPENGMGYLFSAGLHNREILAGLGLSLAIHAAFLGTFLLAVCLFTPPYIPVVPFMTVSLIGSTGFCNGTGDGSPSDSVSDVPIPQRPAQAEMCPVQDRQEKRRRNAARPKAGKKTTFAPDLPGSMECASLPAYAVPFSSPAAALPSENPSPSEDDFSDDSNRQKGAGGGGVEGGEAGIAGGTGGKGPRGAGDGGAKERDAGEVDTPPTAIRTVEPEFPTAARRLGITGKVVVRFLVKTDGSVGRASVIEADPRGIFEQSALTAIDKWRFKPGRHRGTLVATWVLLPIQYRISR